MITVDDGIRKLKLLDAKGKVWTQDMILQVDDKAVSLVDLESKVRFVSGSLIFREREREKKGTGRKMMYVRFGILISLLSHSFFNSCSFSEIRTLYSKVVFVCGFFFSSCRMNWRIFL